MTNTELGTPTHGVPNPKDRGASKLPTANHCGTQKESRKSPHGTASPIAWKSTDVRNQLQRYLDMGLVPIPLREKRPLVKWTRFNPKWVSQLEAWIKPGVNWGVKTGDNLAVIDFDNERAFGEFIGKNIDKLPQHTPIVKTGRGYHVWLRTKIPVKNQHFDGIDIKGKGGYVVAPPSIHPNGQPYRFLRGVRDGGIPEVDLETLDLPAMVKTERASQERNAPEKGRHQPRVSYFQYIGQGAPEGMRHTVMVHYIGSLINEGCSKRRIKREIHKWNRMNNPPLPEEEIRRTLEHCWGSWGDGNVQTSTLSTLHSVNVWTDMYATDDIELSDLHSPDDQKKPGNYEWAPEVASTDAKALCGKKHRILHKNNRCISITFFCGRWDCPRCAQHFHNMWVGHLMTVTKDHDLYVGECREFDWVAFQKRIRRAKGQYAKIRGADGQITIVTNARLRDFKLLEGDRVQFFEKTIPTLAKHGNKPISTSREWQRHSDKPDTGWRQVAETFLPVVVQDKAAHDAGFVLDEQKPGHWTLPEGMEEDKAIRQLIRRIRWWESEIAYHVEKKSQTLNPDSIGHVVKELIAQGMAKGT